MNVELLCVQSHPEFIPACIDLLNSEWPRSNTARLISIQQGSSNGLPTNLILIESNSKSVVGHCKASLVSIHQPTSCFIESVLVAKPLRGKGIGRLIMEKAEHYLKCKGIRTIYLTTHDQQGFYSKLGYSLCEPIVIFGNCSFPPEKDSSPLKPEQTQRRATKSTESVINQVISTAPIPPPPPFPTSKHNGRMGNQLLPMNSSEDSDSSSGASSSNSGITSVVIRLGGEDLEVSSSDSDSSSSSGSHNLSESEEEEAGSMATVSSANVGQLGVSGGQIAPNVAQQPPPVATVARNPSAGAAAMNASMTSCNFECIVCLESLDTPAVILDTNNAANGNNGAAVGADVDQAAPVVRQSVATTRRANILAAIDAKEICATNCGHMYHKYCLQKWFNEQGRRTCPNCRKSVPAKLIRLFPNISQDPLPRNLNVPVLPAPVNVAAPASANPSGGIGSRDGPRQVPRNGCQNRECADLLMIHGLLVSDYNELREAFEITRDNLQLRSTELASLQESFANVNEELHEIRGINASSQDSKRRRRQN